MIVFFISRKYEKDSSHNTVCPMLISLPFKDRVKNYLNGKYFILAQLK